jgi:4-oxalocrotonate tautomerase family enzyme
MPKVIVEWLAIRSQEQKRKLVDRVTPIVADCAGVTPDRVIISFREDRLENWAKGGSFATELYPEYSGENK